MNQLILHQMFWGILGFLTFILVFVKLIAVNIFKILKNRDVFFDSMKEKSFNNTHAMQILEKEICYLVESRVKKIENYLDDRFMEINSNWEKILEKESINILQSNEIEFDLDIYQQYSLKEKFLKKVVLK